MRRESPGSVRWLTVGALALALATAGSAGVGAQDEPVAEPLPQTSPLLPGVELETTEVEPGVYHVLTDGVRGLSRPIEFTYFDTHQSPGDLHRVNALVTRGLAANENGVWLGGPEGIFRLGQDELAWEQEPAREWWNAGFEVTPGDELFRPGEGLVLKGTEWRRIVPRLAGLKAMRGANGQFTADGSYWARGTNGKSGKERRTVFARRDDDGWSRIKNPPEPPGRAKDARQASIDQWGVTDDGVLYITRAHRHVQRFADGRWETLPRPGGRIADLHVGHDGTVWVERQDEGRWTYGGGSEVVRLGEDGWTGFELGPPRYLHPSPSAVGSDGAFWVAPGGDLVSEGGCDGILRLGESGVSRFLLGQCVYDIAAGPNGELWAEAGTWEGNWYAPESVGPVEVYLITPEAWTSTE